MKPVRAVRGEPRSGVHQRFVTDDVLVVTDDDATRAIFVEALTGVGTVRAISSRDAAPRARVVVLDVGSLGPERARSRMNEHEGARLVLSGPTVDPDLANECWRAGVPIALGPHHVTRARALVERALLASRPPSARLEHALVELTRDGQLTPAETLLASAVAAGIPRNALASYLGVTEKTLERRIASVLKKTLATSVTDLRARIAARSLRLALKA